MLEVFLWNGHMSGTGAGKSRPIGLLEGGQGIPTLKKPSEPGQVGCGAGNECQMKYLGGQVGPGCAGLSRARIQLVQGLGWIGLGWDG